MATSLPPASFSASTSSFHPSQSQNGTMSYSDNPLTQLPTVDFNFEDLRKRMTDFTLKFDAFIEQGRKRVLQERNEFRARLGELNEEQRSKNTQITTLQSSLSNHSNVLAREQAEKNEMHAQISKLESHQANQSASCDRLRSAIAQTQRQIDVKLHAQREYAEKMDGQSRLNGPELGFWETYLGCRIEGSGDENKVRILFMFPPIKGGKSDEEREAIFELEVPPTGSGKYNVVYMKPKLDVSKVEKVVDRLNSTREIGTLLKGMRALFMEAMK
ncbi:kinetochore-associated Ndc80 complex subunit spc25 [Exophiala xenobiotica]|nr:kinetochore-associated Ndc80 complex subunit spc25 [Exophiala xenobiotica]KAK5224230.1 kinetochore-associated Ndc80 complex subunit spc25 [Exophiala xenobiotica]KAK5280674.1 kinetochore-associated Ndc80 complex subunit spc25 [Exophiala xenobiotica]KAK5288589.1 kinetochore-associated Ndc80 complex subunit spc25 [Exophiala xenobiotica]KAK5348003.1 kinetochore-associated Ndc80 complex subunit spc25 [Exophiala xenobiotica]